MGKLRDKLFKRHRGSKVAMSELKKQESSDGKEKQKIQIKHRIARCDYDIELLKIGLMEVAVIGLADDKTAILPDVVTRVVPERDAWAKLSQLYKVRREMVVMVAQGIGLEIPKRTDDPPIFVMFQRVKGQIKNLREVDLYERKLYESLTPEELSSKGVEGTVFFEDTEMAQEEAKEAKKINEQLDDLYSPEKS